MVPYITTALSAYGGTVLAKVQDDAADATVGFGRRLLQRIFGRKPEGEALPPVLARVVAHPDDPDYLGSLRVTIRDALEGDAQMLAEVRAILAQAMSTVTSGSQTSTAADGGIAQNVTASGNVSTLHTVNNTTSNVINNGPTFSAGGDINYANRDMTINRRSD